MRRRLLLAAVAASSAGLPLRACAADAIGGFATHTRPPRGVVMMIGGMASAAEPRALPVRAAQYTAASVSDDMDGRQSVVIQPGSGSLSDAARQSSASVATRVMALWPTINEAAHVADVDSALLMAVIDVESGGNPQAVSPKGATGLMQLMPGTGAKHGASDLFDAHQNVAAGARYLKELLRQFGDLPLALAAYNAGEGAVQKYGGQIPPYAETMSYVPRVMARYRWYRDAVSSTTTATATASGSVSVLEAETSDGANGRIISVGSRVGN